MVTPLQVAVVGLGNAGTSLHLPALAGMDGVRVVGGSDLDGGRRAQAASTWQIPVFSTPAELLDRARPDVVIVGTPPSTHAELCVQTLQADAHVLCEKPFVASLAEADRVIEQARRSGRRVAVNHEFREMPIFRAVLDTANRSPASQVVFAQAWQLLDLPPWVEPGWRGQMLRRTLYEAGVHLVDFLVALFREKPVAVSATVSSCGVREAETDAVALVTLEFSRGRLAQVIQNRLCKGDGHYFEVRVDTPGSSLRASYGGRARLSMGLLRSVRPHLRLEYAASGLAWQEVGHRRRLLARNPRAPAMIATRRLFEKTFTAFREGGEAPVSAEDGRDILEVIAACYHAATTGRRVLLDGSEASALAGVHLGAQTPG
jgi:predicted dehydrogenase